MKDQLNVALLGTKFMGWAHSNARLKVGKFFDLASVPIMHTVAGRNAADVEEFAERWGWTNRTADWRTAVDDPEVDLVDMATPNCAHADRAIAVLEAGKRVVCEKPLAGTVTDAEAMVRSAQQAQGHTFVRCNYRRVPAVALAQRIVQSDALGRVYHIRAAYLQSWGGPETPLVWRFQSEIAGSGVHGDLQAHIIDLVRVPGHSGPGRGQRVIPKLMVSKRPMSRPRSRGVRLAGCHPATRSGAASVP